MLRYLAPVTLGVCAVGVGIFSAKPVASTSSNCASSAVTRLLVAARCHRGGTRLALTETMDYTDEAERMAQRVYELYSDNDWKVAKTSVSIY